MNNKKLWADEPTPQTDKESDSVWSADNGTCFERVHSDFARDLERKLRLCQRHLKWVSRCATMSGPAGTRPVFIDECRMGEIKALVERMEQDGEIPLG